MLKLVANATIKKLKISYDITTNLKFHEVLSVSMNTVKYLTVAI